MIITDLDGTLFTSTQEISSDCINSLHELQDSNYTTIIATGRSLDSALTALDDTTPIDYLVFSCGAGIFDWKNKQLLKKFQLEKNEIIKIKKIIEEYDLDYFIHGPIPHNHYFLYKEKKRNHDFLNRLTQYEDMSAPMSEMATKLDEWNNQATQFILIYDGSDIVRLIAELENMLPDFKIIRATSPLDHKTHWIEIFNKNVSKSNACEYIQHKLLKPTKKITYAIGNDYNDLDLLNWATHAFVVNNSPEDLKQKFINVPSNNDAGFNYFAQKILKKELDND